MKQLIALLLIISFTIISWTTCAKSEITNKNNVYSLSYPVKSHSLFIPILETPKTDEGLEFIQAKVIKEKNRFFEISIAFNDKLQQVIAFFTHSNEKHYNVINSNFFSYSNEQSTKEACKNS